jgi:hypothetical protein
MASRRLDRNWFAEKTRQLETETQQIGIRSDAATVDRLMRLARGQNADDPGDSSDATCQKTSPFATDGTPKAVLGTPPKL